MAITEHEVAHADASTNGVAEGAGRSRRVPLLPPLWLFAVLAVLLLFAGAARGYIDAKEYQCYALTFWQGSQAATVPSAATCASYLGSTPVAAFSTLPKEYGPLAMVVFSLPLLGPAGLYPWVFAVEMLAIVLGVALLLRRIGPFGAGHAWLLYVMLGSAATAAARFDVAPAAYTLLALVALARGRHGWANAALAAGTLLKFYPALLLPLFLIESWRMRGTIPWWRGPGIFAACVAVGEGIAWALNPAAVLGPVSFLQRRCVQVESLPATLSALVQVVRGQALSFSYSSNSICLVSPGLGFFSTLCMAGALVGIATVVALYWREALSLNLAAILMLALAMLGSKVFSPQYLLWISPLVALEFGVEHMRAFTGWCLVCVATTLCYPLSYTSLVLVALHATPDEAVPLTAGLRNALLLALVAAAVYGIVVRREWRRGYTARTSPVSRAGG